MEKMRVVLYCRVAHDDGFSLEAQAVSLRRYAEKNRYTVVGVMAEHGNGLTLDRPALAEVTRAVCAGEVDLVLVNNLSRIGRRWGMTQSYIDLLTAHKVSLLCVSEGLVVSTHPLSLF